MAVSVLLLIGSTRKNRQSVKPAIAIRQLLEEKGADVMALDLQELQIPLFDDDLESIGKHTLLEAYKKADGVIILCPEYNHAEPAVVKNAIDISRQKELYGKPLTVIGTSNGNWGGARMVASLHTSWLGVGGIALPFALLTPHVDQFNAEHPPTDWSERAETFVEKSIEWFEIIRKGQES